jgi:predicted O-methyltransferase YrrM
MAMSLSGLAKMIRANDQRKTRFHTERGDLLPPSAMPAVARTVARRVRGGVPSEGPWIASSAVTALDGAMSPAWNVLELGSGSSTAWLARRCGYVTSFESDPRWAAQTRTVLSLARLGNVTLVEVSVDDIPSEIVRRAGEEFDLVLIDCHETESVTRLDCLQAAAPLLRDGGCLVLDDSDRTHLRTAPDILEGWEAERHIGMKQFPLMAIETTIFTKPRGSQPS